MLSLCILCIIVTLIYLYIHLKPPASSPPGPLKLPIVGSLLQLGYMSKKYGYYHLVWKALVDKYGPIVDVQMGGTNVILVSELSLVKEVGLNEALQGRPDGFFYRKRALGGRGGLVFSEGPIWAEQRRFCLKHLRSLGLGQNTMEKIINEEAESLVEWLGNFNGQAMTMDVGLNRFVLNVVWNFTAGKRFRRDDPALLKICDVIDKSFRRMSTSGSILNQLPALRYLAPKLSGYSEYCELQQEIVKFIMESIEQHKISYDPNKLDDLIFTILHQINSDNGNVQFTEKDLFVTCLDLLQAGTDTTSNTMAFILVYLMYNQDVQQKIHAEIDGIIGNNRIPTLADKHRMPYLTAVIQEVQRISNIPPGGVAHRATRETTLGIYKIPKGSVVITFLYEIHRNISWGDPDNFRPERFLDKEGNLINIESFLPFGFGKRRCAGEVLAKANLFLFCCRIFQLFHLILPSDAPKTFQIIDGITLSPAPFKAIWKRRN